jgi:hypothetical protein
MFKNCGPCSQSLEHADMDIAFLLVIAALAAATIGLVFAFERLRGGGE